MRVGLRSVLLGTSWILIRDSADIAESNGRTSLGAIIASLDTWNPPTPFQDSTDYQVKVDTHLLFIDLARIQ